MKPNLLVSVSAALLIAALVTASWVRAQGDADLRVATPATPIAHLAVGIVKSIDPAGRSATIDHRAIPSLNMPAMTMRFRLPSSVEPLKAGELIAFTFTASADGLTIGSVQPVSPPADAGNARPRMDPSTPGMGHRGMQDMEGMKGMMDGCPMMGSR